jgi:hypothetical protein
MQSSNYDPLEFGRRYLSPMLELLLGWTLLVYGVLRLLGRVQPERLGRFPGGSIALIAGGLLVWHACGRAAFHPEPLPVAESCLCHREQAQGDTGFRNSPRYFPYPSASSLSAGMNRNAAEFIQ